MPSNLALHMTKKGIIRFVINIYFFLTTCSPAYASTTQTLFPQAAYIPAAEGIGKRQETGSEEPSWRSWQEDRSQRRVA